MLRKLIIIFFLVAGSTFPASAVVKSQLTGVTIFGNMGAGTNLDFNESFISSYFSNSQDFPVEERCSSVATVPNYAGQCTVERIAQLIEKYKKNVNYLTGMPSCEESEEIPCLNFVKITSTSGEKFLLKKVGELPEGYSWGKYESINLDRSYPISTLWEVEIDGVKRNFLLRASKSKVTFREKANKIQVSLIPFEKPLVSVFPEWTTPPRNAYNAAPIQVQGYACPRTSVWHDANTCAIWTEFPQNSRVTISVKTNAGQLGSINGRVYRPEFTLKSNSNFNELEIVGAPMEVPGVHVSDLGKAFRFIQINGWAIDSSITRTFENLRAYTGDRTNVSRAEWNYTLTDSYRFSLSTNQKIRVSNCFASSISSKPRVGAFMTTNALMGQADPPKFDGKNMSYKLSGFHKNADGSTFSGYYQMIIDSKLARCIYNLKDKGLQAKVSITDNGGETQKAFTQTLKEDLKSGRVYFEVAGFHFSDPIIKVQLTN